jgi:hydrogenase nickel incorporation protein HypB
MCKECGCKSVDVHGDHDHHHGHGHNHDHDHDHNHHHDHKHEHTDSSENVSTRKVSVELAVLDKNNTFADENRHFFGKKGIYVINLISSPGSGKTTIVEYLARHFGEKMAVVVGDIQTHRDAERARAAGCRSVQIETLGACHLDAHSVAHALESLDLDGVKLLVIENVGNLVCPSSYDLGEHEVVAVLSVPEGDDKVLKYPVVFHRAATLLINKIDLAPYVNFDKQKVITEARSLNSRIRVFETAAVKGSGMDTFVEYLNNQCSNA